MTMAVLVENESGSPYRLSGHGNDKLIPAGATVMLSDDEWDTVITGKRGPGQLNPQPMPVSATIPPVTVDPPPVYAVQLDDVGGSPYVTYVGEALPGTLTSEAEWRLKKLIETGPDIAVQWADGVSAFTKEWDERLTYTYS
jgi:hypothetical protein